MCPCVMCPRLEKILGYGIIIDVVIVTVVIVCLLL